MSLFDLLLLAFTSSIAGVRLASFSDLLGWLRQMDFFLRGRRVTVLAGQETMTHMKLGLHELIDLQNYPALTVETPHLRRENLGNSWFLPAEGVHFFKIGDKPFVIKREDVNKETESLTITGFGNSVSELIKRCQGLGSFDKGTVHYTPYPKHVRQKGRGNWREFNTKPRRGLGSVAMPNGVKNLIEGDLKSWNSDSECEFNTLIGRTHKRTYLIHGPPGTGKNSLAEAIVSHLGWDLRSVPCGDEDLSDDDFLDLLASLDPSKPCVLLLDEIDLAMDRRRNLKIAADVTARGISEITLRTLLDGPYTPQNCLIILTANNIDKLSDAVLRPGRTDLKIPLTKATKPMARTLFSTTILTWYASCKEVGPTAEGKDGLIVDEVHENARVFGERVGNGSITPAAILDYLMRHRDHHEALHQADELLHPSHSVSSE
ncbi:MAG: hypothetical protein L6R37_007892 [Teloschistes peruensis]|nr:MAG: hypothetical protein L6R37_007892 [Teloschistes peruensis]